MQHVTDRSLFCVSFVSLFLEETGLQMLGPRRLGREGKCLFMELSQPIDQNARVVERKTKKN